MDRDSGFVHGFRFFAEIVPKADVAVVIDAFADGFPLEGVDEAIAFWLRIADAGVLRLALIIAVKVVGGASFDAKESPCPGSCRATSPIEDAEHVTVCVDVAVLLEAAVRVAAGAIPPENVAVVERLLAEGVVGLLRTAG